jgi:DNA-binding GntR family transcriptional regulator
LSVPEASAQKGRSQDAYDRIRRKIFDHELAPGTRIGEAELTRMLSMSRTPVREALARLESEGLLIAVVGRGFIVSELSTEDLIGTYVVRAALEGLAAAEASKHFTRVDIAHLEDLYEAMDNVRKTDDGEELARLNSEFHAAIAYISGNRTLQSMLAEIHDVFERFRTTALTLPGRRDMAHEEHGLIIEALRRGDTVDVRQIAEQHVYRALDARRSILAENVNIADQRNA